MKTYQKSSPWTLLLPLIVAFAVIAVVVINALQTQQTVSKASYSGIEHCTSDCNSNNPNIGNRIKNKGKCALDCPKVMNGSLSCKDFCSQNVKGADGETKVAGMCMIRCRQWINKDDGSESVTGASGATSTTTTTGFNCSDKCSKLQGSQNSQCISTCNAFNAGTKTCPSGCGSDDPLVAAACFRLFCPTRVP